MNDAMNDAMNALEPVDEGEGATDGCSTAVFVVSNSCRKWYR